MKLVLQQLGSSMCGQACIATLFNFPIEQAIKMVGHNGITTEAEILSCVKQLYHASESQYHGDLNINLHQNPNNPNQRHWTLYFDGKVQDPANIPADTRWPIIKSWRLTKKIPKVGDVVEFNGQDSYFKGTVVSIFTKLDGKSMRCVVQDERGLLLIKDPNKAIPFLNQNPIIWGDGWYAIPDNSNDELTWPVSPKKYFDKTGYCPDGWEGDIPEGWTVDELNNFIDKHGCEPNPPEGFSYCMETTMKCTKDWSFERQKEALIEAGYIIANPKDAKWL